MYLKVKTYRVKFIHVYQRVLFVRCTRKIRDKERETGVHTYLCAESLEKESQHEKNRDYTIHTRGSTRVYRCFSGFLACVSLKVSK